jgi:hypothetical protein
VGSLFFPPLLNSAPLLFKDYHCTVPRRGLRGVIFYGGCEWVWSYGNFLVKGKGGTSFWASEREERVIFFCLFFTFRAKKSHKIDFAFFLDIFLIFF